MFDGPTSPAFAPASPRVIPRPSRAQQPGSRTLPDDDRPQPGALPYDPTASGLYPPMGGHGVGPAQAQAMRSAGPGLGTAIGIGKEEASVRAANALYWAGYWQAMSEVRPGLDCTALRVGVELRRDRNRCCPPQTSWHDGCSKGAPWRTAYGAP